MKNPCYNFHPAKAEDLAAVCALYREATGDPFCTWNAYYPTEEDAKHDFQTGNLYILVHGQAVVGALSVVPENEMDDFPWRTQGAREIARVVVKKSHRGHGLALHMVQKIAEILQTPIHLAVAKQNIPAQKTYANAGFTAVGEVYMYENDYILMENGT